MNKLKQITGKRNHKNGHSFEAKVFAREKKKKPLFILHADGSYGLFDIFLQNKNGKFKGIVVKANGYLPPEERNALYDYMEKSPNVIVELHYKKSERKTGVTRLTI